MLAISLLDFYLCGVWFACFCAELLARECFDIEWDSITFKGVLFLFSCLLGSWFTVAMFLFGAYKRNKQGRR